MMYLHHTNCIRKFSFSKCYFILCFLHRNICSTFRYIANLLTVVADIIARVLKTSGATQSLIYQRFFTESGTLVFFTNLGYMALWKGVLLIVSFRSGKKLWSVLKHKSSSKCAINTGIPENFLSNIFALNGQKKVK